VDVKLALKYQKSTNQSAIITGSSVHIIDILTSWSVRLTQVNPCYSLLKSWF